MVTAGHRWFVVWVNLAEQEIQSLVDGEAWAIGVELGIGIARQVGANVDVVQERGRIAKRVTTAPQQHILGGSSFDAEDNCV